MRRAGLWVAAVMAAGMALPGFAAPDSHGQQQRQAVLRLAEAVAADEAARFGARALMAEAGFALPPAADVTPIGAPTGASISTGSFDLRIALGRLAQAFGHGLGETFQHFANAKALGEQATNGVHRTVAAAVFDDRTGRSAKSNPPVTSTG